MNNGFTGITLPSLFPGEQTYLGATNSLIDNYVASSSSYQQYIPNSTIILREADFAIDSFKSTTSDHLPVLSFFKTNSANTGIETVVKENLFKLVQLAEGNFYILLPDDYQEKVHVSIYSYDGKKVFSKNYNPNEEIRESLNWLNKGIYLVQIKTDKLMETHKWLKH